MPGSYRYVLAALAGMALVGAAQPKQSDSGKGQQPSAEQAREQRAKPAMPPIIRTLSADKPDVGCRDRKDDRSSDLCAQWKAADAAYDAAKWSFWQVVFGAFAILIGGGTLIAAIKAALYARDAAKEAKRGSDAAERSLAHAEEIAKFQVRPYIDFGKARLGKIADNGWAKVSVNFRNAGTLPATNVQFKISVGIINFPIEKNFLPFDDDVITFLSVGGVPGKSGEIYRGLQISDQDLIDIRTFRKALCYRASVEYKPTANSEPDVHIKEGFKIGNDIDKRTFVVVPQWAYTGFPDDAQQPELQLEPGDQKEE